MAGLYHGGEGPLENPDLIALSAILSGIATAIAGYTLSQLTWLREAGNYAVASAIDDFVVPAALVGLLFALGAYLGASAFWLASRRVPDIVPLRVAFGAVTAGVLAFAGVLLVGTLVPLGRYLAMAVTLLAAYYGARLTTSLRRPKPQVAGVRLARVALTASVLLVATLLVSYRPTGWPGADAPIAARDAWAHKTFKEHYAQAVAYVKACPEVTDKLGAVSAIAPAPGTNAVYYGNSEASGDFTLEVVGARGTTLVHAATIRTYKPKPGAAEWERSGELLDGRHALVLGCR